MPNTKSRLIKTRSHDFHKYEWQDANLAHLSWVLIKMFAAAFSHAPSLLTPGVFFFLRPVTTKHYCRLRRGSQRFPVFSRVLQLQGRVVPMFPVIYWPYWYPLKRTQRVPELTALLSLSEAGKILFCFLALMEGLTGPAELFRFGWRILNDLKRGNDRRWHLNTGFQNACIIS